MSLVETRDLTFRDQDVGRHILRGTFDRPALAAGAAAAR